MKSNTEEFISPYYDRKVTDNISVNAYTYLSTLLGNIKIDARGKKKHQELKLLASAEQDLGGGGGAQDCSFSNRSFVLLYNLLTVCVLRWKR